jgi:hypothetical protein
MAAWGGRAQSRHRRDRGRAGVQVAPVQKASAVTIVRWILARIRYEALYRQLCIRLGYKLYVRYNGETITVWRGKD